MNRGDAARNHACACIQIPRRLLLVLGMLANSGFLDGSKVYGWHVDTLVTGPGLSVLDLHPIEDTSDISFNDRRGLCGRGRHTRRRDTSYQRIYSM